MGFSNLYVPDYRNYNSKRTKATAYAANFCTFVNETQIKRLKINMAPRSNFGSKLGAILVAAGSAVGLGNIWRFPTEAGNNGGGAFLIIYIICVLVICIPLLLAEFMVGRHSHANTGSAYAIMSPKKHWGFIGKIEVFTSFLILSYYSVVAGWTLFYTFQSLLNRFNVMAQQHNSEGIFSVNFTNFVSNPWQPLLCMAIFMLVTHFVIVRGVKGGIEKSAKMLMPVLFVLLIILMVCSLSTTGAAKGLQFLFAPDFSKINSSVVMAAMAQAFYSLSLGMGCMCTYASYFSKETNITKTALTVSVIDTIVAVMAGIVIFPAVFSVAGLNPDAGPSLVFIALPNVFQLALGGMPVMAYICSLAFYSLLVVATLTSTISLHEVITAYLSETRKITRRKAAWFVTGGCLVFGALCSLSMGVLADFKIAGMGLFDVFDYVTAKILLLIAGFFTSVFMGWIVEKKVMEYELTNDGKLKLRCFGLLIFALRYIVPAGIALVFLDGLGILNLF